MLRPRFENHDINITIQNIPAIYSRGVAIVAHISKLFKLVFFGVPELVLLHNLDNSNFSFNFNSRNKSIF